VPDFTFSDPDGRSYTVTGPDGSTKEQAFQVLQQQISAGTATEDKKPDTSQRVKDAITGINQANPLNKTDEMGKTAPSPTFRSAANAIASSTAFGGIVGAISPEILTGLGAAVSAIPVVGEVAGPALVATGQALRATRLAAAASGAIGGLTSESAGQAVEAAGGTKGQANAARLVGGLVPGVAGQAAGAVAKLVPDALKVPWQAVQKLAGVTADSASAVKVAKANLDKVADSGQPEVALHSMLQKGVDADLQAAKKAGDAVVADAYKRADAVSAANPDTARRIVDEANAHASSLVADAAKRANVLDKASNGKLHTANKVLAQAAPQLAKVGQVRELSDIGTELRQAAVAKSSAEIDARNAAYKQLQSERDAIVVQKEQAGASIDSTPSMIALKKDLSQRLGQTKGFEQTVDPGVRRSLQQVKDAVTRTPTTTGLIDANGFPVVEQAKTSFQALDQLRRRLGDVISGRAAEGYEAIGRQDAQRMYAQITKAQQEFVGENPQGVNLQKQLQTDYAEASGELKQYGSKAGQKLTATDRLDPEKFAGDPKTLPGYFFNSQQGVRDLRSLTGNTQLVNRQAADYAARSMQGMSAKQAQSWVRDNSEWMREVPGLMQRAQGFATKMEQIERINKGLGRQAKTLEQSSEAIRGGAANAAEAERQAGIVRAGNASEQAVKDEARIRAEGAAAGAETEKQAAAPAKALAGTLSDAEAPRAVRQLLTGGSPEQTRTAARYLAGQPGGQQALDQSVRKVMAGMTEASLKSNWREQIQPMLREGKMLDPAAMRELERDVNRVLESYQGKDKAGMVRRYVTGALAGVGSAISSRN
jgi:hypothetical protein